MKLYALVGTWLPIGAVAWAWYTVSVNVPKWDDHALKAFLLALAKEPTVWGKAAQFLKQHNEHRIAYDRLLTWFDYHLFGKFSYQRLMAYGNLALVALVALFSTYLARHTRRWYWYLPPVALFIVSLAHWENLYWALSAMQNFGVVAWSLWAIYALTHRQRPYVAIALTAVATLVSGNGFLVWPVGAVLLLAQRRFQTLIPWLSAAVVLIALYFYGYSQPTVNPPVRGTAGQLLTGWLAFLGAAADPFPVGSSYANSAVLGAILIGFWAYGFVRNSPSLRRSAGWASREAFAFGVVAFIVGTAMVVVWGRYGFGRDTLITSRYQIYSLTLLAISYCYWLLSTYKEPSRLGAGLGLLVSGLFWWAAFVSNTHDAIALRQYLLSTQYNWTYTTNRPVSGIDANTHRLIDNAPAYYDAALPTLFSSATGAANHSFFPVDTVYKIADNYIIRLGAAGVQQAGFPSLADPDRGLSVLLRSARRTYLFGAMPAPRRNWRVLVGRLPRYVADSPVPVSVDVPIPATDLDPGTYDIAIVVRQKGSVRQVRPTGQLLTVAPHASAARRNTNW